MPNNNNAKYEDMQNLSPAVSSDHSYQSFKSNFREKVSLTVVI